MTHGVCPHGFVGPCHFCESVDLRADAVATITVSPDTVLDVTERQAAKKERALIVAWLRSRANDPSYYRDEEALRWIADAVERGEHITAATAAEGTT